MRYRFCAALAVFTLSCWVSICEPLGAAISGLAPIFALLALLATLLYAGMVFGKGYCCFHPYFSERLSSDKTIRISTYGGGRNIASMLDDLDKTACKHHIRSLSSFGYKDSCHNDQVEWHLPIDGIEAIRWLIENAELNEGAKNELTTIMSALQEAAKKDVKFCFHMKFADGTNAMEHEQREGSYW
jgi:hypothetical protein